jgi:hypothetical protein
VNDREKNVQIIKLTGTFFLFEVFYLQFFTNIFILQQCLDPNLNPNPNPNFFRIRIQPKYSDSFVFGSTTLVYMRFERLMTPARVSWADLFFARWSCEGWRCSVSCGSHKISGHLHRSVILFHPKYNRVFSNFPSTGTFFAYIIELRNKKLQEVPVSVPTCLMVYRVTNFGASGIRLLKTLVLVQDLIWHKARFT